MGVAFSSTKIYMRVSNSALVELYAIDKMHTLVAINVSFWIVLLFLDLGTHSKLESQAASVELQPFSSTTKTSNFLVRPLIDSLSPVE